jgi:putative oxidoreductase
MDAYDIGILILRLGLGLTLAAHGLQKFRSGLDGAAETFESIGMRPGVLNAWLAAVVETTAGLLMAAGFLTPLAAAAFVSVMVVAAWTVHRSAFFNTAGGWEYNFILAVGAVGVATLGAGRISLDWGFFRDAPFYYLLHGWAALVISAGIGLIAAMLQMAIFYRPHAQAAA